MPLETPSDAGFLNDKFAESTFDGNCDSDCEIIGIWACCPLRVPESASRGSRPRRLGMPRGIDPGETRRE
eukprot:5063822-Alexandrium_andersonii.AAC.1